MNTIKFMVSKKLLLALSLLMVIPLVKAQDTLRLDLNQALEIALSENPTIRVADKEIKLKKEARKEAFAGLFPEVALAGSYSRAIKKQTVVMDLGGEPQTIQMGSDNSYSGGLTVSLPIYAPALYQSIKLTKTDVDLALEKSRASKLDMVNQVTKAFYQLLLSQDSYEVLKKSYAQSEENYNIVKAKFEQGLVSEYDKISAEVQMRSIKPNLISAANAVTLAKLQLKVLMGITADVEIKINDSLTNYEMVMFANQLKEENVNLNNNTTMKQLDLNMKLLEKNVKSLKTNFMPTLSMSFSYQYQSLYNPNINFFNYNWSNSSSLMFNLSIPLYKASNFTKVKSARIQMRQLDWNRIDTERQLNMQIVSCRNNMSASTEQVVSNKENVMQAKKAVVIAEKRYDVGKGTVLELNSSQVSLTQAQLTYNQSIYDYLVAKADLDQVLGKE